MRRQARFNTRHRRQRKPWIKSDRGEHTQASKVTVYKTDGTVEVRAAYTPEQLRELAHARPLTARERERVRRRDRDTCRYCGRIEGPFEVDHVVPRTLGGSNKMSNLVLACKECNGRKGQQIWTPRRLPTRLRRSAPKDDDLRPRHAPGAEALSKAGSASQEPPA